MADRYQSDDRSRRDRTQRGRQAEQFQSDYDEERGSRQMGDSWRDDEFAAQQNSWQSDDRADRERSRYRGPIGEPQGAERFGTAGYGPARYAPGGGRSLTSFTGNDFGGADFSGGAGTDGRERAPIGGERAYGRGSYDSGSWGSGNYGAGSWLGANHGEWRDREFGSGHGHRDDRGLLERAGDAVARWFGDDEYGRGRETHRGHGPAGYTRTDERIREDACERLTDDWGVDARQIEVTVSNAEITLDGTVASRDQKRRAEDLVENLSGVKHVQNNLRVDEGSAWDRNNSGETSGSRSDTTTGSI